jgi:hypothetical protein
MAEPRRRRRRGVDHLSNLEQLLVFGSDVVASSSEESKHRVIHQVFADYLAMCNQTLAEVYFKWGNYVVSDA